MSQQSVIRKIAFREFLTISLGASVLCIILYLSSGHLAIIPIFGIKAISWAGIIGYFMYFRANYTTGIRNAGAAVRQTINDHQYRTVTDISDRVFLCHNGAVRAIENLDDLKKSGYIPWT